MTSDTNGILFPLGDEHSWVYRVRLYLISHSQLQIEIGHQKTERRLYINFTGVEFYDGPLDWSGKGFSRGAAQECLQILKRMEAYANADETVLLNDFSLFVVEPETGYRVRIVASGQPTLSEENLFSAHIP